MMFITSFFESNKLEIPRWSSAVYQPKGYKYPKADWMDIRDETGDWIRPRRFLDYPVPSQAYRDAVWKQYLQREDDVKKWLDSLKTLEIAICCWCPYDRAAQRQLKTHGSFICHTSVVGLFLEYRMGISIEYDKDRERMLKYVVGL